MKINEFLRGKYNPFVQPLTTATGQASFIFSFAFLLGEVLLYFTAGKFFFQMTFIAFAAESTMAFFGFLYGIPPDAVKNKNPFLVQIADWLTKIIVGLGIANLGNIPAAAQKTFEYLSRSVTKDEIAPAVVGAIIIYFGILGFFIGFGGTKLFLNLAIDSVLLTSDNAPAQSSEDVVPESP
jgi:hypothetical protein